MTLILPCSSVDELCSLVLLFSSVDVLGLLRLLILYDIVVFFDNILGLLETTHKLFKVKIIY